MVREKLPLDTSFDAFIYSENAISSSLVTVLTLEMVNVQRATMELWMQAEGC